MRGSGELVLEIGRMRGAAVESRCRASSSHSRCVMRCPRFRVLRYGPSSSFKLSQMKRKRNTVEGGSNRVVWLALVVCCLLES